MIELMFTIPGAFFAPIIHEFVKARVSTALGDRTPRDNGFITWNPFKFFEVIGFVLMMAFQMGWGKPVPTSALHYKNRRNGVILTYTMPILANLIAGVLGAMAIGAFNHRILGWAMGQAAMGNAWALNVSQYFFFVLLGFALCNISLAIFNLLPVYPLAGNKLIQLFVAPDVVARMNHYEKPMQIMLILLLAIGVLPRIASPIVSAIYSFGLTLGMVF